MKDSVSKQEEIVSIPSSKFLILSFLLLFIQLSGLKQPTKFLKIIIKNGYTIENVPLAKVFRGQND